MNRDKMRQQAMVLRQKQYRRRSPVTVSKGIVKYSSPQPKLSQSVRPFSLPNINFSKPSKPAAPPPPPSQPSNPKVVPARKGGCSGCRRKKPQ